jgi:hypothetical protein
MGYRGRVTAPVGSSAGFLAFMSAGGQGQPGAQEKKFPHIVSSFG